MGQCRHVLVFDPLEDAMEDLWREGLDLRHGCRVETMVSWGACLV